MQDKSFFFHELKMGMICEIKLKSEFNSSAFDKKRSTVAAIISKSQTKLVWSSHKSTSPRRFPVIKAIFNILRPCAKSVGAKGIHFCLCSDFWHVYNSLAIHTGKIFRCLFSPMSRPGNKHPLRMLAVPLLKKTDRLPRRR